MRTTPMLTFHNHQQFSLVCVTCRRETGRWVARNIYASPNSGKKCDTTFSKIDIILHIYLCSMCSNCSGERSFSKLKWIKNELRSSLSQQRLNHLSLMSIESELSWKQNLDKLMHEFAYKKARKILLSFECLTWWCRDWGCRLLQRSLLVEGST